MTTNAGTNAATTYPLTADELAFFRRHGYVGPLTIYTPDEMTAMWRHVQRAALDRSCAAYPETDAGIGAPNIYNYDRHLDVELLAEHVCNQRIVDRVAGILGPDLLCWRSEFFPKYPGDEGTDWHQADTFANASGAPQLLWPGESVDQFGKGTLTVWTAFTESTRANGCLQIIPGTQHTMNYDETKQMHYDAQRINTELKDGIPRGFFGYDYRELQIDPHWRPDERDAVSLVMEPGQCVIFWSTLMHASLPNTSRGRDYRMGFATRYVPTTVRVYPDTDEIEEYGGSVSLERWGAVLARGRDDHGLNRIATTTLRGTPFRSAAAR